MPSGSRASRSRREQSSQSANANIPRSIPTASVPRSASRRSITAVSPLDSECFAGLLEVAPQILEVVDFAVEDDRPIVAARAVGHRLVACGREVDDRETTVPQHAPDAVRVRGALPDTRAIRTTMRERIGHPLQGRPVPAVDPPEDARYSTHRTSGDCALSAPGRPGSEHRHLSAN